MAKEKAILTRHEGWEETLNAYSNRKTIGGFLDRRFGSLFSYRFSYMIVRPWKIADEIWSRIVWAWQRVFRGWDDRVIWSIDFYLAKHIPEWMEILKVKKHGVPSIMFKDEDYIPVTYELKDGVMEEREKEYNAILDEIADGFHWYYRMHDEVLSDIEDKLAVEKHKKAMDLFAKYFNTFWD
jgi:hypothetical protein